ncbi:hypothetical protein BKA62DRAFT_776407 [Auriculariales sp. MPI-PUGE-AT-0066]|nr:hypothetical protein BKA62DRAFT_776407 [Auriculariales sp. MPI-PUGE-AT-0066]
MRGIEAKQEPNWVPLVNGSVRHFVDPNSILKNVTADDGSTETKVYNPGDIAWVLASTALVWLMVPGVGFFYSGLLRRKNALSMIMLSMLCVAVVR